MGPSPFDGTDIEILTLLQQNARRTVADVAARVALSPTAAKRRIDRLEQAGVIRGYAVQIDFGLLGWGLEAFTEVRFTGNTRPGEMDRITARLPEVQAVFTTAGDQDALVWIRVRNVEHLTKVIDQLRGVASVVGTRTHIVLSSHRKPDWHPWGPKPPSARSA